MSSRILPPDTRSSASLYATLRRALLDARTEAGSSIVDLLGGPNIYYATLPEGPVYPYIALRALRETAGANGFRERIELEVQVIAWPQSQARLAEEIADYVDRVFLGYTESGSGLVFSRSRTRQTLPAFSEPADRDRVGVLLQYAFLAWPLSLQTAASNP
jgi:hypothetical protein